MQYLIALATTMGILAILGIAQDLILGYAGRFSVATMGMFAIGAYAGGITLIELGREQLPLAMVVAVLAAGLAGAILGIPSLRLEGSYLIVATLGFHFLVISVLTNWRDVTGGVNGLIGIPRGSLGPVRVRSDLAQLLLVWSCVALAAGITWWLTSGPIGERIRAARDDTVALESLGFSARAHLLLSFVVSSGLCGLAGILYATYVQVLAPIAFGFELLIVVFSLLLVGGQGTIVGPIVGSVVLVLAPEVLRWLKLTGGANDAFFRNILYGIFLILVIRFRRRGSGLLSEDLFASLRWWRRWARLGQRYPSARPGIGPGARAGGAATNAGAAPVAAGADVEAPNVDAPGGVVVRTVGLRKRYGGNVVLDGVDVELRRGRITALIGPNGAGKTTLIACLGGQVAPDDGAILLGTADVAGARPNRIARAGVSRQFQNNRLFERMCTGENVVLAARLGVTKPMSPSAGPETVDGLNSAETLVLKTMRQVGLPSSILGREASRHSGGQRRLISMARSAATQNEIVLLDEPTAGVAPDLIPSVLEAIASMRDAGITVCVVEHNLDVVREIADSVYVLAQGRVIAHGGFDEVMTAAEVRRSYLT